MGLPRWRLKLYLAKDLSPTAGDKLCPALCLHSTPRPWGQAAQGKPSHCQSHPPQDLPTHPQSGLQLDSQAGNSACDSSRLLVHLLVLHPHGGLQLTSPRVTHCSFTSHRTHWAYDRLHSTPFPIVSAAPAHPSVLSAPPPWDWPPSTATADQFFPGQGTGLVQICKPSFPPRRSNCAREEKGSSAK